MGRGDAVSATIAETNSQIATPGPLGVASVAPASGLAREAGGHTYTLDGEPVSIAEFVADNSECLEHGEVNAILRMRVGETFAFGGGAAAELLLMRVA